jgi:NADH-quinone oxidoreductase subunit M
VAEYTAAWITLVAGVPLLGAGLLSLPALDAHRRLVAVAASAIGLLVCLIAAAAFREMFSAPLLPFVAGIVLVTLLTRPRRTEHDGFFRRALLTEALLLAVFTCGHAPVLVPLWWALAVLPLLELRSATEEGFASFRFEAAYLFGSAVLFSAGVLLQYLGFSAPGDVLIVLAVLSRAGMFPFHSWVPAFFGRVPPGPAMLAVAPQFAVTSAAVLLLSGEHPRLLVMISVSALVTSIHAAALGLVQRDARRALAWLFLSQSAGVLVGMASGSAEGSAGGLMIWISCGTAGTGLALALWALEARRGRLDLDRSHGGYDRMPLLASSFLLMGLALVGFPGTLGFVGQELLVEGSRGAGPYAGFFILLATALNGITLLRMYFRLFCGTRDRAPAEQSLRLRERIGFTAIVLLLVLGGLAPRAIVNRFTPSPPPATAPGPHR